MILDLENNVVEALKTLNTQASERKITLGAYLDLIVNAEILPPLQDTLSVEKFDAILNEISDGINSLPCLPADFSRA